MSTRKDRPNHPELYGLSFEQLILKAQGHLQVDSFDLIMEPDRMRIGACLDEMLWRQRREVEQASDNLQRLQEISKEKP